MNAHQEIMSSNKSGKSASPQPDTAPCPQSETTTDEQNELIEIAPDLKMPLRKSSETWQAIQEGRIVSSTCPWCSQDLTCIEDAEYMACADCWVFSRNNNGERRGSYGVCIGVTADDMVKWLEDMEL